MFLYSARASIDCILHHSQPTQRNSQRLGVEIPSLHHIQRLCTIPTLYQPHTPQPKNKPNLHRNQPRRCANSECSHGPQLPSGCNIALRDLLHRGIAPKPRRRICSLAGGGRDKALEEAAVALFTEDYGGAVKEPAHAWLASFTVINSVAGFSNLF